MLNIFIEDLGAKNAWKSVSKWITLPMEEDKLREEISDIFYQGSLVCNDENIHDEGVIDDYEWDENITPMFSIDPYDSLITLNRELFLIKEKLHPEKYKVISFLFEEGIADNVEDAIEKSANVDVYEDSSLADVAEQKFDDYFGLDSDKNISRYLDFEQWGYDLRLDGYYTMGDNVFYYPQ